MEELQEPPVEQCKVESVDDASASQDDDDDNDELFPSSSFHSVGANNAVTLSPGMEGGTILRTSNRTLSRKKGCGYSSSSSRSLPIGNGSNHSVRSLGLGSAHTTAQSPATVTPLSARGGKKMSDKLKERFSRFEANPGFADLLSPMQSFNDTSVLKSPNPLGDSQHSATSNAPRRSVQTTLQGRVKAFDSPKVQNRRVLLTPAEVKALVLTSSHRLDNILGHYEKNSTGKNNNNNNNNKSSDEEVLALKAQKELAKERHRKVVATLANTKARQQARQQRARGNSMSSIIMHSGNTTTTHVAYPQVRAIPYDFTHFQPPSFPKTPEQRKLICETIARNFVFAEFRSYGKARTSDSMEELINAFQVVSFPVGQVIVHQGVSAAVDANSGHFFIIERGHLDFQSNGVSVGKGGHNDCFGEQALLYHSPSNVTVSVAISPTEQGTAEAGAQLLQLDQKSYRGILHRHAKLAADEKREALLSIPVLRDLLQADESILNRLASIMIRQEFQRGDMFGASEDKSFFIVHSGQLQLSNLTGALNTTLNKGDYFGERTLIGSLPRRSLVVTDRTNMTATSEKGVFFKIDRVNMEQILGKDRLQNLQDMSHLMNTDWLQKVKMSTATRDKLAALIVPHKALKSKDATPTTSNGHDNSDESKEKILFEVDGKDSPALYVVREGTGTLTYKDPLTGSKVEKRVSAGDVFGQDLLGEKSVKGKSIMYRTGGLSVLTHTPSPDSPKVEEEFSLGVLPVDNLNLTSPMSTPPPIPGGSLRSASSATTQGSTAGSSGPTTKKKMPQSIRVESTTSIQTPAMALRAKVRDAVEQNGLTMEDVEKLDLLGEGEFGEVWLVAVDVFKMGLKKDWKPKFALKSQRKEDDTRGKDAAHAIQNEINAMRALDHPQVVDLVTTFEDDTSIHILMGLVPGGEIWNLVHREDDQGCWNSGMSEEHAKFYSVVVADTLGFMHSKGYIFRDLKPENIMIDADGYPVLVDFGFAKYCPDMTYTFCGTPNYVAPEIITNSGHNRCVDFWALGVTIYEMITGENPFFFEGMDQMSLYDAICHEAHYPFSSGGDDNPPKSKEVADLVEKLLEKDPVRRLGMLSGGIEDILHHDWFAGLDLVRVRNKRYPAPWKPNQEGDSLHGIGELEEALLKQMGVNLIPPLSLHDSSSHSLHDSFVSIVEGDESMTTSSASMTTNNNKSSDEAAENPLSPGTNYDVEEEGSLNDAISPVSKKKSKMTALTSPTSEKKKRPTLKKKSASLGIDFKVSPTTAEKEGLYFPISNPKPRLSKTAKESSRMRRTTVSGVLAGMGITSDDEDDFLRFDDS